jgi:truncated hemoglobin YjbI
MSRPYSNVPTDESPLAVAHPFPPGLAAEIGWDRIATVVDAFYDQVAVHPALQHPFAIVKDWPHHKDRLTYFWWVVLGGEKFRRETYEPVPKHFRAGFNEALLSDWLALFQATVQRIVPEPLAALWAERAKQVGAGLVIANKSYANR